MKDPRPGHRGRKKREGKGRGENRPLESRRFRAWKPSFLGAFAVSFREGTWMSRTPGQEVRINGERKDQWVRYFTYL